MTRYYFTAHPADLEDESLDAACPRLRGEIGVDGLVIDALAPARLALRPRLANKPRIAAHEAAAWFQPTASHYANTRLRPNTAHAIKSRNALARMIDAAAEQGLTVRAAISLFDNTALVARHATIACVDLFGRPHESRLCPAHPDVREYAAAVVEDVATNLEIEAIELGDFHFGRGLYTPSARRGTGNETPSGERRAAQIGRTPLQAGLPLSDAALALVGWCFCSACRQRADELNVEADAVVAELTKHLAPILELRGGKSTSFADIIASSEQLSAYAQMRRDAVTSLVRGIRRGCPKPLYACVEGDEPMTGLNPEAIADFIDGLVLPPADSSALHAAPMALVEMIKPDARRTRLIDAAGGRERVSLELPCHPPRTTDGPALVAAVHEAAKAGYAAIAFTDYGLAPEPCLDWVRQAIRFARREAP